MDFKYKKKENIVSCTSSLNYYELNDEINSYPFINGRYNYYSKKKGKTLLLTREQLEKAIIEDKKSQKINIEKTVYIDNLKDANENYTIIYDNENHFQFNLYFKEYEFQEDENKRRENIKNRFNEIINIFGDVKNYNLDEEINEVLKETLFYLIVNKEKSKKSDIELNEDILLSNNTNGYIINSNLFYPIYKKSSLKEEIFNFFRKYHIFIINEFSIKYILRLINIHENLKLDYSYLVLIVNLELEHLYKIKNNYYVLELFKPVYDELVLNKELMEQYKNWKYAYFSNVKLLHRD